MDSPYSHRAWGKELGVPYPMISDFGRQLLQAYSVPEYDMRLLPGTASRSAFLVDAGGIIRYVWYQSDSPGLPPVDQIMEAVRALPGSPPNEAES